MAPFEALYGRRYRSPIGWFERGESRLYGTDLVKDSLVKVKFIQERHHTAQSRQKSYADQKARIMRFGKKGKLSPRFIGPFEVLRLVGDFAYEIALPTSLSGVHLVFHVSMLRKYHPDWSHVLDYERFQLDESLGYEEEPLAIIDRHVC
ncbi:uncharacterized protein [Nicotiana tomentosiformis]|uniref:uncharacterized protein n=1 Tax=Nicotiana tomentosiformis TaxID=4098 RepID=UPI00388C6A11